MDDNEFELYAVDMSSDTQKQIIALAREAESMNVKVRDKARHVHRGLLDLYGKGWNVLVNPEPGKSVDYEPDGMIFFLMNENKYLVWRADPRTCNCCYVCCM